MANVTALAVSAQAPLEVQSSVTDLSMEALEKVVVQNDISKLTARERLEYYQRTCAALMLNPLTRPFQFISLSGKLTLYATKDATEQLRKRYSISLEIVSREMVGEIYIVTARAKDSTGRVDEATGAVAIKGLTGESLANAYMKAETKAKRRVTLSICGLGCLDVSETTSIPGAQVYNLNDSGDLETGARTPALPTDPGYKVLTAAEINAYVRECGFTKEQFESEIKGRNKWVELLIKAYNAGCISRAEVLAFLDDGAMPGRVHDDKPIDVTATAAEPTPPAKDEHDPFDYD